jgi:hypothetical protein
MDLTNEVHDRPPAELARDLLSHVEIDSEDKEMPRTNAGAALRGPPREGASTPHD